MVGLATNHRACQAQQATYELGNLQTDEETYSIDVVMEFRTPTEAPAPSHEAVFFSLDVSDSTSSLAPSGDYSRFSFSLDPSLDEWNQIPNTGFGTDIAAIEFETIAQPLPAGRHRLGILKFDAEELSGSLPAAITITADGTSVGAQLPSDPPSFEFVDTTFSPGVVTIPEPTGNLPVFLAICLAFVAFRKSAR